MDNFKLYYDILSPVTINPVLAYTVSIIIIAIPWIIIALIYYHKKENNIKQHKIKFIIPIIITIFVIYVLLTPNSNELSISQETYLSGNYETVEGYVENFDPMPYGGHKLESFTVNGVYFEYSDYQIGIRKYRSFNNTKSHGGPIGQGKYVRIDYIIINIGLDDINLIMKLWIRNF